jgi:5'(3')-deoxyribonucleotidase
MDKNMIYVDMDGVIADFFGGLEKKFKVTHWKLIDNIEEQIMSLRNTDFFYILDKYETSDDLIHHVRQISNGNWGICSSPLRNDFANSTFHKRRWLEKNMFMPAVSKCIFTSNKHKYATSIITGEPNILIDDKLTNIDNWNKAGGIAIRYQANEDDLEEYLFMQLDEALKGINS